MGGLAALFRFDRAPVEHALLERVLAGLGAPAGAAYQVPATTPELALALLSRGHGQEPLDCVEAPRAGSTSLWLAFDGRIDNRSDLESRLGAALRRDRRSTDAELLLAGYLAWGEALFDRVVGPFAVVLADTAERSIRLVRDPLAGRALFYCRSATLVAVASRSAALVELGSTRLDEESIARYLAIEGPRPGSTFFEGVHAVRPGELVRLDTGGEETRTVATLSPAELPDRASDSELEQRFRHLLDLAVDCRLPKSGRCAILMSGGLDSTSIAATAARATAAGARSAPITISWVFDELRENDERRWIEAASRSTGLRSVQFAADGLWPLSDEPSWPRLRESPFMDLYWRLLDRSLRIAREEECSVLLTGYSADDLWTGGEGWLPTLLAGRRFTEAAIAFARAVVLRAGGTPLRHGPRASLRLLVGAHRETVTPRPWLTPEAEQLLLRPVRAPREEHGRRLPSEPATALLLPHHLAMLQVVRNVAASAQVDMRCPFRDRRLVEFLLAVPPHVLYRPGESKRLLRRALVDRLPDEVLRRQVHTSLLSLARRGLSERAWPLVRDTLGSPGARWPRYVRADWLWSRAAAALENRRPGIDGLVLWHCYNLERWLRTLEG